MKSKFDFSKPPPRLTSLEEARALIADLRGELLRIEAMKTALEIRKRLLNAETPGADPSLRLTPKARRKLEKRLKRLIREHDLDDE